MTGGIGFTPGLFRGHGPHQALKAQTALWGWTQSHRGEECGGRARECVWGPAGVCVDAPLGKTLSSHLGHPQNLSCTQTAGHFLLLSVMEK